MRLGHPSAEELESDRYYDFFYMQAARPCLCTSEFSILGKRTSFAPAALHSAGQVSRSNPRSRSVFFMEENLSILGR